MFLLEKIFLKSTYSEKIIIFFRFLKLITTNLTYQFNSIFFINKIAVIYITYDYLFKFNIL